MKPLMKYEDLAHLWRVDVRTLQKWIAERDLPHLKLGRLVRFDPEAVANWASQVAPQDRVGTRSHGDDLAGGAP